MMMWHPIGSQVACKVVFRPMPSGRLCKCLGTHLKHCLKALLSASPSGSLANMRTVCLPGEMHGCDPPSHLPHLTPPPPQCSADSLVYVQIRVISPSSTY